jgi:transposase
LVETLPSGAFKVNERGSGSRQYPPSMMLALIIYCYSKGIFSSRRIEQATYENVPVRYLTGDTHPDHDTIAAFRRNNAKAIERCFARALLYAKETGLLKLGAISVDSTLLRANASKSRNVRYADMDAVEAYLEEQVRRAMEAAESADCEDDDAERLPPELSNPEALQQKVREARAKIEARTREHYEQKKAKAERLRGKRSKKTPSHEERESADTAAPSEAELPEIDPKARANLTDPDSRLVRRDQRSAYEQGFRAQAVADADGTQLILGTRVSDAASDTHELLPTVETVSDELGECTAILADSGYANQTQVATLEAKGYEVLVSVRSEHAPKPPYLPNPGNERGLSPIAKSDFGQRMRAKLETEHGKKLYKRRRQSIEACFGLIKHVLGFRNFHLRGLQKVNLEWMLVALAYNIKIINCAERRNNGPKRPDHADRQPTNVVRLVIPGPLGVACQAA